MTEIKYMKQTRYEFPLYKLLENKQGFFLSSLNETSDKHSNAPGSNLKAGISMWLKLPMQPTVGTTRFGLFCHLLFLENKMQSNNK